MAKAVRPRVGTRLKLGEAPCGARIRVVDLDGLPPARRLQLQALGISPGRPALVQQQEPVTIVLCGHTEIALEGDLASRVLVELVD